MSMNEVIHPLDCFPLVRSRSLDEARQLYSSTATPTRVEIGARESFECHMNYVAIGR